jgi:hypothetical protein
VPEPNRRGWAQVRDALWNWPVIGAVAAILLGLAGNAIYAGDVIVMPPPGAQFDQQDVVLLPTLDSGQSFDFLAVNQSNRCVWLIPPELGKCKNER